MVLQKNRAWIWVVVPKTEFLGSLRREIIQQLQKQFSNSKPVDPMDIEDNEDGWFREMMGTSVVPETSYGREVSKKTPLADLLAADAEEKGGVRSRVLGKKGVRSGMNKGAYGLPQRDSLAHFNNLVAGNCSINNRILGLNKLLGDETVIKGGWLS